MRWRTCLLSVVTALSVAAAARGEPSRDPAKRADAVAHFELGVAHFDREEWDAALAEFLESRALFATPTNTRNAAVCLRRIGRFDEALEMQERLLSDFPDLPDREREAAQTEIRDLQASVGSIELRGLVPGARVVIDGRERGVAPLGAPVRVGAGTHAVNVSRDGYLPFEARVDVAGTQIAIVDVELATLTAAGRLRVSEQTGKSLQVVVDGEVVGTTPWEGALAPGPHVVLLRSEGLLGTPPAGTAVKLRELTELSLAAEPLGAELRIEPSPPSAALGVDGVALGRGAWRGRLRAGRHRVTATAEGFVAWWRDVELAEGGPLVVVAALDRDPALVPRAGPRGAFVVEGDVAPALGIAFGSELASGCTRPCSASWPLGLHAVVHGAYELESGFGFGVDAGYLLLHQSITARPASITPKGLGPDTGTVSDSLTARGLTVGASAQYHRGREWPLLLRIGAGVFAGSTQDARTGSFTDSTGSRFSVSFADAPPALYACLTPEIRVGRRLGQRLEVTLGAEVLLMAALKRPLWSDGGLVLAGRDGVGSFPLQALAGSVVLAVAPGIGARYAF